MADMEYPNLVNEITKDTVITRTALNSAFRRLKRREIMSQALTTKELSRHDTHFGTRFGQSL